MNIIHLKNKTMSQLKDSKYSTKMKQTIFKMIKVQIRKYHNNIALIQNNCISSKMGNQDSNIIKNIRLTQKKKWMWISKMRMD